MSKEICVKGYLLNINDIEVGDLICDELWYYRENLPHYEAMMTWTDFDGFFKSDVWKRISGAKHSRFGGKKITFGNLRDVITKANFEKAEIVRFYTQVLEPYFAKDAFERLQFEDLLEYCKDCGYSDYWEIRRN